MKFVRVILSPEVEEVYRYLNEHSQISKIEKAYLILLLKK